MSIGKKLDGTRMVFGLKEQAGAFLAVQAAQAVQTRAEVVLTAMKVASGDVSALENGRCVQVDLPLQTKKK